MSSLLASARQNLLGEEPEEKSAMEEMEEACCGACPKLTWKQKMIGCATCMFIGCLIEFGWVGTRRSQPHDLPHP